MILADTQLTCTSTLGAQKYEGWPWGLGSLTLCEPDRVRVRVRVVSHHVVNSSGIVKVAYGVAVGMSQPHVAITWAMLYTGVIHESPFMSRVRIRDTRNRLEGLQSLAEALVLALSGRTRSQFR